MGDGPETGAGGCLCGAVRYQVMGKPLVTGHCHCADCRRHNGAPVVTLVIFEADKVRFTEGERKIYESSPAVGRAFCDQCGTPLTIEGKNEDPPTIEFHISTFDDPDAYVPSLPDATRKTSSSTMPATSRARNCCSQRIWTPHIVSGHPASTLSIRMRMNSR